MKKRQSPILLVSFLVIFVGAAVVMNIKSTPTGDGHNHEQEQAPQEQEQPALAGDSRKADSKEDLKKAAMSQASGSRAMPAAGAGEAGENKPTGPAIFVMDNRPVKPTPNSTATSQQWYREEARDQPN